jgi:hypothetical protein
MNYVLVLIIGLLIGYLFGHDTGKHEAPPPPPVAAIECPASPKKMELIGSSRVLTLRTENKVVAKNTSTPAKLGRQVIIGGSLVSQMENAWNELPKQIQLRREDDGWRVLQIEQGSLFAKSGLMEGDLITDKAIESLRIESGDLPERFFRIFNHVTH